MRRIYLLATGRSLHNAFCWGCWGERSCPRALRRVIQWPWIEHPTFQLGGGYSTTELVAVQHIYFTNCCGEHKSSCLLSALIIVIAKSINFILCYSWPVKKQWRYYHSWNLLGWMTLWYFTALIKSIWNHVFYVVCFFQLFTFASSVLRMAWWWRKRLMRHAHIFPRHETSILLCMCSRWTVISNCCIRPFYHST